LLRIKPPIAAQIFFTAENAQKPEGRFCRDQRTSPRRRGYDFRKGQGHERHFGDFRGTSAADSFFAPTLMKKVRLAPRLLFPWTKVDQ
jgi:hypothetical protein